MFTVKLIFKSHVPELISSLLFSGWHGSVFFFNKFQKVPTALLSYQKMGTSTAGDMAFFFFSFIYPVSTLLTSAVIVIYVIKSNQFVHENALQLDSD